jgi:hypothetical protein
MKVDLLGWAQAVHRARIQWLARTCFLSLGNRRQKGSLSRLLFSITKVVSVMRLVASSEGRKQNPRPHFSLKRPGERLKSAKSDYGRPTHPAVSCHQAAHCAIQSQSRAGLGSRPARADNDRISVWVGSHNGNRTVKRDPSPSLLSTATLPPCRSTTILTR